jgi:uncharacterized membrane protein
VVDGDVLVRLSELERQVRSIEVEIGVLRALTLETTAPASVPAPRQVEPRPPVPPPVVRRPVPPTPPPAAPSAPAEPAWWQRDLALADLVGPRAFAWAGGLVTLLGVVFLFVLAVDKGWIGPVERVGLGALASALVFVGGLVAHRRYGNLYAAVSAVGAGIAGGYATLLAAAALYDLVPPLGALGIAAAIATIGTALALAWSSETVAAIGLLGAMAVPLSVAFDGGLSTLGIAFAAIVFAAIAIVAVRRKWRGLLLAGAGLSLVQIGWLVLQEGEGAPGRVVVLAACFWLLYLATGVARQLSVGAAIDGLVPTFVLGSGAFAAGSAAALLNGETLGLSRQGAAMLAAGAVTGLIGSGLYRRNRDLGALLAAVGLAVGAIAFADVLGGPTLTFAWAAEAAVLAWLAARIGDTRFGAAAVAYAVLAAAHVVVVDAPPRDLFEDGTWPGVPAILGLALGLVLLGWQARRWADPAPATGELGIVAAFFRDFASLRPLWSAGAFWAAGLATVYAASRVVLELALGVRPVDGFDWGHVAVTGLWMGVATGLLAAGLRLGSLQVRLGAYVALGVTLVKVFEFDGTLPELQYGLALLVAATAALADALLEHGWARPRVPWLAPALALAGACLAAGGPVLIADSAQGRGFGLLALAAGFGALAAVYFPRPGARELATALWGSALALGLGASTQLLAHTELVLVWAGACVVLAVAAERLREPRLQLAGLVLGVLAVGETLGELARPDELFRANPEPANGVVALAASIAALAVAAALARVNRDDRDALDESLIAAQPRWRPWAIAAAAALALYAASLTVLGLSVEIGTSDLTAQFQRGHTVVSALWGLVGLVALTVGLRRGRRALRRAGVLLFGVALVKLFVYDLSTLSPMARAFSFLAVGGVLLLAGFFYQRLAADLGDRNGQPA